MLIDDIVEGGSQPQPSSLLPLSPPPGPLCIFSYAFTLDSIAHQPFTLLMTVFQKPDSELSAPSPFRDASIMMWPMVVLSPLVAVTDLASRWARGLSIFPSYTAHPA